MTNTALTDDEGFGLVEAVVSMLILATLAIAFLPLFITGLKQSATNSTQALATQLVSERMSLAQSKTTCTDLTSFAASVNTGANEVDPTGREIEVETTVEPGCVVGTPDTFAVTTVAREIVDGVAGAELARASTLVLVK